MRHALGIALLALTACAGPKPLEAEPVLPHVAPVATADIAPVAAEVLEPQAPRDEAAEPLTNQHVAQIACVEGNRTSCKRLTLVYGNSLGEQTLRERYATACQNGDAGACYDLGWRLMLGLGGLERFVEQGFALLELACMAGHARACFDVAQSYRTGDLTPAGTPDPGKYRELIARACELGSSDACDERP